jgi:hypothetical protein
MSYESELCDLARTVELALVALAAEQDAGAHGLVQVALEGLQTKTVNIKKHTVQAIAKLYGPGPKLGPFSFPAGFAPRLFTLAISSIYVRRKLPCIQQGPYCGLYGTL